MTQILIGLRLVALIAAAAPADPIATRVGPDRYRLGDDAVVVTANCTVTADRHPVRLSVPDARGRVWLRFVGEGDPCQVAMVIRFTGR